MELRAEHLGGFSTLGVGRTFLRSMGLARTGVRTQNFLGKFGEALRFQV